MKQIVKEKWTFSFIQFGYPQIHCENCTCFGSVQCTFCEKRILTKKIKSLHNIIDQEVKLLKLGDLMSCKKCVCGCDRYARPGSKYFNKNCERRYVQKRIENGEIKPTVINICEICGIEIPRYKERGDRLNARGCCPSHRRLLKDKENTKPTNTKEKKQFTNVTGKVQSHDRGTFCIRDSIECINYYKWGQEPNFNCPCTEEGYKPKIYQSRIIRLSNENITRSRCSPKRLHD